MKKKITVFLILCHLLLHTYPSFAEDSSSAPIKPGISIKREVTDAVKPASKVSKNEMIQEIISEIDADEDVLLAIPGLKKQKDSSGKEYYSYNIEGRETKLEDLDEDTLEDLMTKSYTEGQNIRDLEIIHQAEMLQQNIRIIQQSKTATNAQNRIVHPPVSSPVSSQKNPPQKQ